MQAIMPNINSKVITPDGEATVKSCDFLKGIVEVIFTRGEETERKSYHYQDLEFTKGENE